MAKDNKYICEKMWLGQSKEIYIVVRMTSKDNTYASVGIIQERL